MQNVCILKSPVARASLITCHRDSKDTWKILNPHWQRPTVCVKNIEEHWRNIFMRVYRCIEVVMRVWILESNWRSVAWQETRPGTKQRLSLAAKQPKRFLSGFTQPQRTPILSSWIQLDTIPILFFTSPSYPNICAPQATVDKACLGSFTSAQLAESRMFGHKQKPEKVREGHKAAGSAWMTLSFPPPTCHTCHLAQLSTKQAMQETPNWNARTAVRCCQCATICFFGTCSSTYKHIQAVLASTSRKWVCQVILPLNTRVQDRPSHTFAPKGCPLFANGFWKSRPHPSCGLVEAQYSLSARKACALQKDHLDRKARTTSFLLPAAPLGAIKPIL